MRRINYRDFRSFFLAAWTLLVNNILCASFGFNCPQNILVLVFNYLFKFLWLSLGLILKSKIKIDVLKQH